MSSFLVSALCLFSISAIVVAPSASGASRPKSLVTCVSAKTGTQRILVSGSCNSLEKKVVWKYLASGSKTGAIVICTNNKTGSNRISTNAKCTTGKEIISSWVKSSTTSASQTPAVLSCAQGGKCARKDVGPGGGLVFYVADTPQPWGNYLEVAPAQWSSSADPRTMWCNLGDTAITTAFDIGDGKANSATLAARCTSSAAALALAYRGGGKSDWYLPSYKEIKELHGFVYGLDIPGFSLDFYWSSSQDGVTTGWAESFGNQGSVVATKSSQYLVRPIRAF